MTAADLIDAAEVAELLGVSVGRARNIARERDDFPEPALDGGRGQRSYWRREDVEHWSRTADRRPGRRWPEPPTRKDPMTTDDDVVEIVDELVDELDPVRVEREAERLGLSVDELLARIVAETKDRIR